MDFRQYVRERLSALALAREPEIVDELAEHLSDLYEEARTAGASHEHALARAAAAMPGDDAALARHIESAARALPGLIVDRWRATHLEPVTESASVNMFSDLRRDLRYAVRMLSAAPGFTAVVFMTLALGVGANAVIFTAIDAILLETPGIRDPESLVSVYNATTDGSARFSTVSYPDFADLRDAHVFQEAAAYSPIPLAFDRGEQVDAISGELVSGGFFDVLGTPFSHGRGFLPDEDRRGVPVNVVVVSDAFWRNRLDANPAAVGRTIRLNGRAYSVVGIAPPLFTGATVGAAPDVWAPMALQQELRPPSAGLRRVLRSTDLLDARAPRWLSVVARLKPGTTVAESIAAMDIVARRLQAAYPDTNAPRAFDAVALGEGPGVRASSRPLLRLLGGSVLLVLLIACANISSLLLARSVSRRREVAVRIAVGAGRSRLVRQWLTESVLLSLAGGLGGLLIAYWGAPLLHIAGIPDTVHLAVNGRVLTYTFVVAAGCGVLFGLAPVVQTMRCDTIPALRDEGGAVATGSHAARLRRAFVVFQVAVSLMLLVGAGLFLRTLRNAQAVDLGYRLDSTMVADINLDLRGYSQEAGTVAYQQILDRLAEIPGVAAAGAARIAVLSGGARTVPISRDGRPVTAGPNGRPNVPERDLIAVRVNVVSDGYLDAMGIPLIRGRDFSAADRENAQRVAIVSRSLAATLWPNQDPLGKSLGDNPALVVGVVPDTVYRDALEREPPPFFYLPLAQNYEAGVTLHVRAAHGDPLTLLPLVPSRSARSRSRYRHLAAATAAEPVRSIDRRAAHDGDAGRTVRRYRAGACGLGLYGVMAHLAGQRRTEIGIRLALGAKPTSILSLIMGEGLRVAAIGAVVGLAAAFAATRWLESQLFGVRPTDPLTFAAVCLLLTVVAIFACLIPARRAMRIDPAVALRSSTTVIGGRDLGSCTLQEPRSDLPLFALSARATSPWRSTAEPCPSAACRSRRCRSARRRGPR